MKRKTTWPWSTHTLSQSKLVARSATPEHPAWKCREHRRLFSSGRGSQLLIMMDADHGKIIQSLPISAGVDAHIFEPETGLLFVSTSSDKPREVETVKIEYGARNIDPKTHNLFLTTADCGPDPAPTKENPHPEREPIPGTFRVLIYGR